MTSHLAGAADAGMADARSCASPPPSGLASWDVHECSPETNELARVLLYKWLKHHEATSPKEIGTDVNENTYHAAMVYLVERSAFLKQRAAQRAVAGADAAARAQEGGQASIQDIVAGTETTVWQFFKAMTKVLELAEREQWLTALVPDLKLFVHEFKHIEVKFMFVYMLHEKLKKTYTEICYLVDDESGALRRSDAELHTNLVHLVWALFLAVREKENLSDLVPGFFLLIACLHAVLSGRSQEFQKALVFPEPRDGCKNTPSAPAGAAAGDAGDGPAHTKAAGGGADSTSMLAQLCRAYCGKEPFLLAQAQDALGKVHAMLDELLPKTAPQGYKKDVDGRGVGEDAMLHVSLSALTSLVVSGRPSRSVSGDNVEVDGLIFLQHPELVGSASEKAQKRVAPSLPSSPSKFPRSPPRTASTRVPCSPMRGQQAAGAPKTPERGHAMYQRGMSTMQAVTPMQGVMKDVRWLSIYVQAESARPDEILRTFLAACDTDQTASVVARLDNLPQKVVEDVEEDLIAMAVKLYLKSLRFILQREEERLKRNNFTNILQDDSMHRAFLAICFEMVFHIHMRHHLSFPQIPIAFGVCALEFYIMTDNFLTYFQDILPTEVRRHLARKRENILDQHMWKKESTLVAHLRERDLAAHLSRALETCHKGAALPAQASPMIVRSCLPPARPVAAASEGLGAFLREAGLSGGCGGLAAALAMQQPVPKTEAPAERAVKAEKSAAEVRAEGRAEDRGPQAKQQAARGVPDKPDTPERKDVQMSAATTPFVDKANKNLHILKQLTSVARGLWRRVSSVTTALCRALQVSESSLNRALNVANRILCSAKARELLHDRHLHQVLMCVVFAACRVEDPDKVLFRKIINHHHNLFAHLQLDEKIYWVLDIGPAANQTGNLIEFYNKKFIPLCKEFVLEDTCMPASAPSARTHASGTGAGAIGAARLPPRSPMSPARNGHPPRSPSVPRPLLSPSRPAGSVAVTSRGPMSPPRTPMQAGKLLSPSMGRETMTPRTKLLYTYEASTVSNRRKRPYDESDEGADNGVDTELLLRALKKGGSSTFSQPPPLPTAALAGAAAPQGAKKDLKGILSAASQ